jgi:lipoprotein NlpI
MAYRDKADYDHAIANYTRAMEINPNDASNYLWRGNAELYSGALPKALADLNQAAELNPKYAYAALWLDIVNQRSNLPSRLADATKQVDMTKWPAPVIRLYLGQLTPEAVLAATENPNRNDQAGQVCEANFYNGELALRGGDKDKATRLFRSAAASCPNDYIEYASAISELKALGASR